jgi:hypothetical protein
MGLLAEHLWQGEPASDRQKSGETLDFHDFYEYGMKKRVPSNSELRRLKTLSMRARVGW